MKYSVSNVMLFFGMAISLCLWNACSEKSTDSGGRHGLSMTWVEDWEMGEGTKGMVELLDTIQRYYESSHLDIIQLFSNRKTSDNPAFILDLYEGKTKDAIKVMEASYETMLQSPPSAKTQKYLHALAIAYLRLGEEENCIHGHKPTSCILPIKEAARHTRQEGALKAIQVYQEILSRYPEDLTAKYLFNLAHMLLGKYPDQVPVVHLVPLNLPPPKENPSVSFKNIAPALVLDVRSLSGGAVMEDFNNDGNLDIAVSGWDLRDQLRIFMNDGKGGFTDVTQAAGLTGITGGLNMICADYDNDGFRDLLVLRGAWRGTLGRIPNSLLKNNGDGTFSDVTQAAGILSFAPTQTAAFADFNRDGWLDLFIGNETGGREGITFPCEFYMGNKDGVFSNKTREWGVNINKFVKGVAVGDYDNDGWEDLYLSCRRDDNVLLRNEGLNPNGSLSFADMTQTANVHQPQSSFATWFWDYDNDGHLDLFVAGYEIKQGRMGEDVLRHYLGEEMAISNPAIYHNNGDGTFSDQTVAVGMNVPIHAMGANFGDINHDGFPDIYLGTGEPDFKSIIPNRMYLNVGGQSFQDITAEAGVGHIQKGHGVAFGDIDNDGDQDLLVELGGAAKGDAFQNALFENMNKENNWLYLVIEGETSNRDALGARVKVLVETAEGAERTIHKRVSAGGSFGANSLQLEIGLGNAKNVQVLEIHWPSSGTKQVFHQILPNQRIKIKEDLDEILPYPMNEIRFTKKVGKVCH